KLGLAAGGRQSGRRGNPAQGNTESRPGCMRDIARRSRFSPRLRPDSVAARLPAFRSFLPSTRAPACSRAVARRRGKVADMSTKPTRRWLAAAMALALAPLVAGSASAQGLSFAAPHEYAVGTNPQSVAAVDLNRDGRLDLVVANAGSN